MAIIHPRLTVQDLLGWLNQKADDATAPEHELAISVLDEGEYRPDQDIHTVVAAWIRMHAADQSAAVLAFVEALRNGNLRPEPFARYGDPVFTVVDK